MVSFKHLLLPTLFLLATASGWLIGCASQPNASPFGGQGGVEAYKIPNTPTSFPESFSVTCADPAKCSPSVGAVLTKTESDSLLCTGTLVSPNHIITNKHCIGDQTVHSGASCSHISFVFPPTTQYPEKVVAHCARFADVPAGTLTDAQPLGSDYVVLELTAPMTRPALKINSSGIPDGTSLQFHHADPELDESKKTRAVIRLSRCTAVMNSVVLPLYNSSSSPMLALPNCKIMKGNSGSSLLDENGEVRGLVSSIFEPANTAQYKIKSSAKSFTSGRGINMACVKSTALKLQPSSDACKAKLTLAESDRQYQRLLWDRAEPKMQAQFEAWKRQNPNSQLQWRLKTRVPGGVDPQTNRLVVRAVSYPSCFAQLGKEVQTRGVTLTSAFWHDDLLRPVAESAVSQAFDVEYGSDHSGAGWITRTYSPYVLAMFSKGFSLTRCR